MHAPRNQAAQQHRKNSSGTSEMSLPSSLPPKPNLNPPVGNISGGAPGSSTLNPNAGGFQPGGLGSLAEVPHEVLMSMYNFALFLHFEIF